GIAADIRIRPDNRDRSRSVEDSIGVERQLPAQEIVQRIAVEQRAGWYEDQALVAIGDVDIGVERVDGLLAIFRLMLASRVRGNGCGGGHRGGEGRPYVEPLAQRRYGGGDDPLGESLVINEGDIEDPETGLAAGRVEVFAAGLDRSDLRPD